ncbi:MAG: sugar transferase [Nitrospirota bacterium]
MKRLFDFVFSSLGIIVLLPLFAGIALAIKMDNAGPVFFRQERIGKDFKAFRIYKFRTMAHNSGQNGPKITSSHDKRITRTGKYLRRYKLDELPQLFNVLKGDMSFVGPRPEVEEYVNIYKSDYSRLLRIRPGITDPASIQYSNEETILASADNWEEAYKKKILPEKIRLSLHYVDHHNLSTDLKLICKTILKIT